MILPPPQPDPTREPLTLFPQLGAPIVGYRIWRIERHNDRARLCSIAAPTTWLPGQELRAYCWPLQRGADIPEHRSPWGDGDCECGVWGFKSDAGPIEALWTYSVGSLTDHDTTVAWAYGIVKLWGRVVECTNGWRGEYAYPAAITILDHEQLVKHVMGYLSLPRMERLYALQEQLVDDYGIPVKIAEEPPIAPFDLELLRRYETMSVTLPSGAVITTRRTGPPTTTVQFPPMSRGERIAWRLASLAFLAGAFATGRWMIGAAALLISGVALLLTVLFALAGFVAWVASLPELDFEK